MLWWFAQTTLIAGGLAVVATLAGRWSRLGPEVKHSLWLLVMLKLAIPPLIAWPWAVPDAWPTLARVEPRIAAAPAALPEPMVAPVATPMLAEDEPLVAIHSHPSPGTVRAQDDLDVPASVEVMPGFEAMDDAADPVSEPVAAPPEIVEPAPVTVDQKFEISNINFVDFDWESIFLAAWLAGSVAVVARRGFKVFRFHRSLSSSIPAPEWLVDEARAIGDRVGVRPPPVVTTPWVATPLLWCLGRPRLILPEILIKRLGVDRWSGILAHELAHLARGDHWVVRLELLVEAVWWWNPLFWLVRRRLRELAEVACDARVVRALPDRRFDYAEALVDVCEHIARAAIPSPSLGVGGGGGGAAHLLEGRLHMILKDPAPHRPSRRAAMLAVLLAALAAPAWTLGQQPEPPPSKPDAPASVSIKEQVSDAIAPKPAPAPETPKPVTPPPIAEPPSIEAIRDALATNGKWAGLRQLTFRLVVADRVQSRQATNVGWIQLPTGMQPTTRIDRFKNVTVKVADVVLDARGLMRCDVLEARRATEGNSRPTDGNGPRPADPTLPWDRRFVALDAEGYTALGMAWDQSGPVPFRWLGARGAQSFGDSLTAAFFRPNNGIQIFQSSDLDRAFEPLDPRPRNILDLAGVPSFLNANNARVEVLGFDKVEGRDAVRIAWSASADIGLRGLCWVAPELGGAVVLLNATQDPPSNGTANFGRRSWRKRSSDFVKLTDHLWLPRKVTYEETQLDPAGGEPPLRREREMTFEDYRVDQPAAADTFRPRLTIRDLDDRSGSFTADAPAMPAGLVDRLAKAVAESKFGPIGVEKTVEELKPVASTNASLPKPGDQLGVASTPANSGQKPDGQPTQRPNVTQSRSSGSKPPNNQGPFPGRTYADIVTNVDEAPVGRLMFGPGQRGAATAAPSATPRQQFQLDPPADPAKADPDIIARTAPKFDDPIPTFDPKVEDPTSARPLADRDVMDRAVDRRFKLDPEVSRILAEIKAAETKLDNSKRQSRTSEDPAIKANQRKLDELVSRYKQFWDDKSVQIREELDTELSRPRDEAEVLKARRDGKAAAVRKAEAQRDLAKAVVARNARLMAKSRDMVSQEEVAKADAELAVAEAEVASKQAELAEADALLNQTRRRSGGVPHASDPTTPSADRTHSLANFRDGIELMEVQLQAKQAELRGVEAKANLAGRELAYTKKLAEKKGVSQDEVALYNDKAEVARAEVEAKKAEVLESETRIKQAQRRLAAAEARLNREVERAKADLANLERLSKAGEVTIDRLNAARAKLEELVIELGPEPK